MIALFFDTETTGVKTWQEPDFKPGLVQLGCILQDTESKIVLAEVNLIVNQPPRSKIPSAAVNIHKISDEMAEKYGVDIKLVDIVFAALIKKADLIVAHNIDFDMDIVADNMPHSHERIKDKKQYCTMDNNVSTVKAPYSPKQRVYYTSKGIKPEKPYKVPSLTETYKYYFGIPFEGAHDAMADIRACRDVYFATTAPTAEKGKPEVNKSQPKQGSKNTELIKGGK